MYYVQLPSDLFDLICLSECHFVVKFDALYGCSLMIYCIYLSFCFRKYLKRSTMLMVAPPALLNILKRYVDKKSFDQYKPTVN